MNNTLTLSEKKTSTLTNFIGWAFGTIFFAIGVINTFWGNDPVFGVFIMLLSLVYFIPVDVIIKRFTGYTIPGMPIIRIVLGLFILWAALGVGELFSKIELMEMSF
jgi:hypothetical protein